MTGEAAHPRRLVLLGHPVAHSLSPRFQNAALRDAGIPLVYEAVDVLPAALAAVVERLSAEAAAGNVTVPHKAAMTALCDELTPTAARAGAVNTFYPRGAALVGDNTDVAGFHLAAARLLGREPGAERVALLGAGGAAAGILCAIERWGGATATVYNRSMQRAEQLASRFAGVATTSGTVADTVREATLVVNATTIGLVGDDQPVPVASLPPGAAVLDAVYRPGGTAWVVAARAAGFRADDGLTMLVEQGACAFVRWFGRAPNRAAMWAAVA